MGEIRIPPIEARPFDWFRCNHTTRASGTLEKVEPNVYRCRVCGRLLRFGAMAMEVR